MWFAIRHAWILSIALGCVCAGLVIGELYRSLTSIKSSTRCFDLYAPGQPGIYSAPTASLKESSHGRPGLKHITLLGGKHHGVRDVEVWDTIAQSSTLHNPQLWLQTFAPNTRTPVHHHDHEEVFWVLGGSGVVAYQESRGGAVHQQELAVNSTLVIRPHIVHQVGWLCARGA